MTSIYETLPTLPKWEVRFWTFVLVGDGCWGWYGHHTHDGYARFSFAEGENPSGRGRDIYAHVWLYEKLVGDVPVSMELDHLCKNRGCVNPEHLEPVTHKVNIRRGRSVCKRGHQLEGNRKVWACGRSVCGTCHKLRASGKRITDA